MLLYLHFLHVLGLKFQKLDQKTAKSQKFQFNVYLFFSLLSSKKKSKFLIQKLF